MQHKSTAVIVRCMDKRHWEELPKGIKKVVGDGYTSPYDCALKGGAGIFASLKEKEVTERVLKDIAFAIDKGGAKEIWLAIHGCSDHDGNGCGGYVYGGFEKHFKSPEASRIFSIEELKQAAVYVKKHFPQTERVRAFYVTFGPNGENNVKDVL